MIDVKIQDETGYRLLLFSTVCGFLTVALGSALIVLEGQTGWSIVAMFLTALAALVTGRLANEVQDYRHRTRAGCNRT
jgi:1,4-dihydroxy-2-naphthoate octaprenyltransferase